MSFYHTVFNTVFKRNSVFLTTIFAGAFVFQAVFDEGVNKWWEARNKGKLWKDVKLTIPGAGEEEDDE
ncbi:DEKNAAC105443 [Brettanomyces naardenensis]|uniref:Complex III subunit 9 n=1 Tax=Brettanomyces naardenensis TaxID=13370 RepID=A0A448YTN2_BRENA|nr:DEKNAAC105443 [Brettanomyces naardenensis]